MLNQSPCTILIVDDNPEDRQLYQQYLLGDRQNIYTFVEAESAQQGLNLWHQYQPDVVLLHYHLSDFNGLEFLLKLQASIQQTCLPVIVVTGQESVAIAVQAMKAGAQDYLVKGQLTAECLRLAIAEAIAKVRLKIESAERKRIEEQLRESQYFAQQIAETIPGILYVYDLVEQRNVYVNHQVTQLLGYSVEQVQTIGANLLPSLIHPDDFAQIPAHIARFYSAQNNEVLELEYRMQHANGEWRWFYGREVVFGRTLDGSPKQILGVCQDVTERKQTEVTLHSTMARFEQAAAAVNCLIYEWDLQQGTVNRIRGLVELVGFSPEEAGSALQWWGDRIHPDDFAQFDMDEFWRRVATKDRFSVEYRVKHKQGHYLWVQDHQIVVRDAAGKAIKIVGSTTDITDRKAAEVALRESEKRYRQLVELCPDGIFVQVDGRFVFANQAALDLFRAPTPDALIGKPILDFVCPEYRNFVCSRIEQIRQGQAVPLVEEQFLRLDGTIADVEVTAIPFIYNGQPAAQVAVRDISDRKAAEAQREELLQREQLARAEAERANRIKDEFLTILSHELRSPLNPILGWTKLMQSRSFNPTRTAEALATIERNAKLQTQLIDDLLDVAKILRGKLTMNAAPVSLEFVIESAIETVRTAAQAKSVQLYPSLCEIGQVRGDAVRLQQVVWNLLSNAVKFTPGGGRVDIVLERVDDQVQIAIRDTGKGIKPDFLPHIFESFRQEDSSTTRKYGGLGLGLAIVRSLVEAHGGTIVADSKGEGLGATFTVRLPLLSAESEGRQSAGQPEQGLSLVGIRVLAVDNEPDAREVLSAMLMQYGAEILMVATAEEVLSSLESFRPNVLVSDVGMPDLDGYGLIQQIRALPSERYGQVPAIALTAYARDEDRQRALAAGFQHHIAKPLEPGLLAEAIAGLTL